MLRDRCFEFRLTLLAIPHRRMLRGEHNGLDALGFDAFVFKGDLALRIGTNAFDRSLLACSCLQFN